MAQLEAKIDPESFPGLPNDLTLFLREGIPAKHDLWFRQASSLPCTARQFLEASLPTEILLLVHWHTLEVIAVSGIRPALTVRHEYVLFRVHAGAFEAWIYFWLEPQSRPIAGWRCDYSNTPSSSGSPLSSSSRTRRPSTVGHSHRDRSQTPTGYANGFASSTWLSISGGSKISRDLFEFWLGAIKLGGMSQILIIGLGYLGMSLARRLQSSGWQVRGWVRSEETAQALRQEGWNVHAGDVANPDDWPHDRDAITHVVHCASSSQSGPEVYAQVYREGIRQALAALPMRRLVFVSSTSVYAQTNGEWVDETSVAEPQVETGRLLREAEDLARSGGGMVARVSAIYGPGRGVLLKKFLQQEAVIEGDGQRWLNQIQRDDIAAALQVLLDRGTLGETYNVSDGAPCTLLAFYEWLASTLDQPLPPRGPIPTQRKRGLTNKRVRADKLRELGWVPHFPDFRSGYRPLLPAQPFHPTSPLIA